MLSKKNRIQNHRLISKLQREGQTYKTSHFIFRFLPSHLPDSKFAVAVSKNISSKAVRRNKLRRQITESLRTHIEAFSSPLACLITIKKGSPEVMDYAIVEQEILDFINHQTIHV